MTEKAKTRIILILIVIIGLSATLFVCYLINPYRLSESKEADISPQHQAYAERAIEIADKYLDFELSADSAYLLISDLESRTDELPNTSTSSSKDLLIESKVSRLKGYIFAADTEPVYNHHTLITRNELAELIGEKER